MSIRSWLPWSISLVLATAAFPSSAPGDGAAPPPIGAASGGTTNPPADVPRALTTFEANGFRVSLDTCGFQQDLGYERFKRNYFRLAQFTTTDEHKRELGGGFTFSLLVDDLPKGVKDLKSLFVHCIVANKLTTRLKDGSLQPVRSPRSAKGMLYRYPQRLPVPARFSPGAPSEITQWQWYFESIQNGKWFEIHFSRGVALDAPVPEGIEPAIDRILRSLQFPGVSPEQ
jgi:hypothetical protein